MINAQELKLLDSLKKSGKKRLGKKDFQTFSSILGNLKNCVVTNYTTRSFEEAKKSVSQMQSLFQKIQILLTSTEKGQLKKAISSLQSEINEYGHQQHDKSVHPLQMSDLPGFMNTGSSDDIDDFYTMYNMMR